MFKKALLVSVFFYVIGSLYAENINTTIEINNVIADGGLVYVAVYSNFENLKNEHAFISFILESTGTTLIYSLELPEGEYAVSVFQDSNNNGILDENSFGIPIERVGITNYNLRGAPGNFNRRKVPINRNSSRIIINMGKIRPLGII